MRVQSIRRGGAAALVGAVAFAGVLAAPQPAQAAIEDGYISASGYAYNGAGTCTSTSTGNSSGIDFLDNGAPYSRTSGRTYTITNSSNTAEKAVVSTSSSVSATATPIGAGPARINFSFSGSASMSGAFNGTCRPTGYADGSVDMEFTLPVPMWLTMTGSGSGSFGAVAAYLYAANGATGASLEAGPRTTSTSTAYLPAGSYEIDAYGTANVRALRNAAASFRGSIGFHLAPAGSAGPQAGKGGRFVSFGARSCASGATTATINRRVKKQKVRQVQLLVNGKRKARLAKKRLKPRTVALAAPAAAPMTVTAVIRLKNGKKVTVSRSYLAC